MTERRKTGSVGWAFAAIALSVLSWSAAFLVIAFSLREMRPIPLATARFEMAGLIALGWLIWKRPKLPSWPHMLRFAICGLLGFTLYSVFINTGQTTVSVGAASFISNIIPIMTALLAWVMLGERFKLVGWLGCAVSFTGVTIIAINQPGGLAFGAGATFILLAALCSAAYFVLQKPLVAIYGALPCTAYTLVCGALFLLPWAPEATLQFTQASPSTMAAVTGLALLPTLLAYFAWNYALGELPAGLAANFLHLVAPLATLFAFVFFGDHPSVNTILGGAMAMLGTIIVARWGKE
ncbi:MULTISPECIES: DMT family transporter [Rhizobium/Agrobacterium group]|uniref:DMT family transporter n=1 Tax=Rhizobium/Agrobacterium group TaxID=227290 RepID=UPI00191E2FBE|nr:MULTISPECIES: DMT family transporter [Rhizobium/Agrobacterium group]